jgi:hypothetical protein
MRDLLPPEQLASLLATFTPPLDPTDPDWIDLCSALDSYDHAAQLGLSLDEARYQVDAAATILYLRCCHADPPQAPTARACPRRGGGVHEHQAV